MKQRMRRRIFFAILAAAAAVLLASLVVVTGYLYAYFGDVQHNQLSDELEIAAAGTERWGLDYVRQYEDSRYRLTWIDLDGAVLFDTRANAADMENHADREEIFEALRNGNGSSSRYSATLTERTFYAACTLSDGSILRLSISQAAVAVLIADMIAPVLLVFLLAMVLSALFAQNMARRIVEPLNQLNLERPLDNTAYEELSPLLNRIHSQHRQIQKQLAVLQQKTDEFNQITTQMTEGLVLLDSHGVILSLNAAAARLFQTETNCLGQQFLTVTNGPAIHTAIHVAQLNGHSELRLEQDGRQFQVNVSRIESDGKVVGTVILTFDISQQADAERMRREFTANVSHELKTPLQSIMGAAELLESGLVREEDIPTFANRVRTEAARLVGLIEDILRLSQLDEGSALPTEAVDLKAIAEDVCTSLQLEANKRSVTCTVLGDTCPMVGVRRLLHEILYNLTENAIKYNYPDGRVFIELHDGDDTVTLSVRDTGIGIPDEHRDRVFERFYRVDKSHSKQSGGTGLGLSIVKHAVAHHGGTIVLKKNEPSGTAMVVTLPKYPAEKN